MKTTTHRLGNTHGNLLRAQNSSALSSAAGFTLIELMMVIIIVAVLLAIGLPAYQDQIIRGHRAEAKSEMLEIANRQQQYLLSNRSYTNNLGDISYDATVLDVGDHYTFSVSTSSGTGAPSYTITATAIGRQSIDGNLTLNSEGEKLPEEHWRR